MFLCCKWWFMVYESKQPLLINKQSLQRQSLLLCERQSLMKQKLHGMIWTGKTEGRVIVIILQSQKQTNKNRKQTYHVSLNGSEFYVRRSQAGIGKRQTLHDLTCVQSLKLLMS